MKFAEITVTDRDAVALAADHLVSGGLLAHPTAGVYGIGGAAKTGLDREVERLKGRPAGPGIVHLIADAAGLGRAFPEASWPPLAARLAAEFWPGLLTLVLDDGSEHGVAVRVEPHPFTRAVLQRWGGALGSTSLNLAGEPPAVDPDSARRALSAFPASEVPVLFAAAGRLPGPPPSTLVRVPGRDGRACDVLRAGAISPERIARVSDGTREVEPG